MINTIVNDTIQSVSSAYAGADLITLILFAISALLVGARCNSLAHLFDHALEALLITAVLYSLYVIAVPDAPTGVGGWSRALADRWRILMEFSLLNVLGFYLLMVTAIGFVFGVKRLITRR